MGRAAGIFVATLGAVILLSSAKYVKNSTDPIWCWDNSYCPTTLACSSNICTDLCFKRKDRECMMENHHAIFKCKPGHEVPKNSIDDVCLPVKWMCYVDNDDPHKIIKCNSPKWFCRQHGEYILCGINE